jgi:addiction module HigA family antidote
MLREDILPALRMSQVELAERLGVSRVTVNTLLQEKRDLSVELAARIANLLGHSPESWLRLQEALLSDGLPRTRRVWRTSSRCHRNTLRPETLGSAVAIKPKPPSPAERVRLA